MVEEIKASDGTLYVCERCRIRYRERTWAEKCEDFCSRYNACSIEIVKHAVKDENTMEAPFSAR